MSDTHPLADNPVNPSVRYERTDAHFQGIMLFGAGLVVVCVACAAILWGVFVYAIYHEDAVKKSDLPFSPDERAGQAQRKGGRPTPFQGGTEQSGLDPRPRLEGMDPYENGRIRTDNARQQFADEDRWLGEAGWLNHDKGVVHMPIEQAMKKVAGELKAREGVAPDETTAPPSRSSSGREPRGDK